jgi:hypothetical protein
MESFFGKNPILGFFFLPVVVIVTLSLVFGQ